MPVIKLNCIAIHGYAICIGAAARGPHGCTCDTLTDADHARAVAAAWEDHRRRDGRMCHDCAFRSGSPERESGELHTITRNPAPFRCHQGMPNTSANPEEGEYVPRTNGDGDADEYPECAGWRAAYHRRLLDRGLRC